MMNNMFSIFDPSTSYFMQMNWISLFSLMMFIPMKYYYLNSRITWINTTLTSTLITDLKNNLKNKYLKSTIIFISFFIMILLTNFLGLFSYIFTPSSHVSISLSISLPLWLGLSLKGWIKTPQMMLTHLTPLNSPTILCPFMVIIETISNVIRPMTLAIRLSANMIAGHLLISLLSNTLNTYNPLIIMMMSTLLNSLIILEMAVAIIQSYVFITLLSLYLNEIH